MILKVNKDICEIKQNEVWNVGDYNVHTVEVELSDEFDGLVNKVRYFIEDNSYDMLITDNVAQVPYEATLTEGTIKIGVYGYDADTNILVQSTSPVNKYISSGTYTGEADNTEPLTPTDKQQMESAIQKNTDDITDLQNNKQDLLISGENIKTINNESILGTGNIEIDVGSINYNDLTNKPSINNVELSGNKSLHELGIQSEGNYATVNDLDTKQNTLISGTNIKTINNNSILGSGNIDIQGGGTSDYTDLTNKPKINNVELNGNKSLNDLGIQPVGNYALESEIPDVSNFITKDVNNLTNYTLKTNTGSLIDLEINDTTYVVTLKLKNQDGTIISTDTIDLPLESVVVSGRYDNTTKKVILTLENGSEVDFSVADLVAGLQTEITSQNKLASDLVDDTNSGNKFVTTSEKQTWNNKYDKPNSGIPKTDLASTVQTSLNKADTAIQEHQDISGKEDKTNKVTSIDNTSTDTQYPSAKCVHDSQATQDDEIEALQTENERLKATLPTTTGEGQDITLDKTAEMEFVKPPLPRGNSEQNGEPRPDNEVPITNVTGNVEVTISNENNTESKTLPVSLGNIELCKIGDYQDYIYKNNGKWYKHKVINKYICTGEENWTYSIYWSKTNTNVFYANVKDDINFPDWNSNTSICNYFITYSRNDMYSLDDNGFCFSGTVGITGASFTIRINKAIATDLATFKSWLSTHNTILYYVLATPTDTEITDTTLISQLEEISKTLSYEGQTNITSNTIALFNVEAYQSTKLILENLDSRLTLVEG